MKGIVKNYTLGSLACIIAGIVLIIDPHIVSKLLGGVIGAVLIIWGALGAAGFVVAKKTGSDGASVISLLGSAALVFCGIVVFSHKNLIETLLMFALGIFLVSSGLPKVMAALELKNKNVEGWTAPFFTSCLTTLLGIVIIISPALLPGLFMTAAGALLLIGGIGNFIGGHSSGQLKNKLSEVEKDLSYRGGKSGEQSGEVIDIDPYDE